MIWIVLNCSAFLSIQIPIVQWKLLTRLVPKIWHVILYCLVWTLVQIQVLRIGTKINSKVAFNTHHHHHPTPTVRRGGSRVYIDTRPINKSRHTPKVDVTRPRDNVGLRYICLIRYLRQRRVQLCEITNIFIPSLYLLYPPHTKLFDQFQPK